MAQKIIKYFQKTHPHVRKHDGETVEYVMRVNLTATEAAILENFFDTQKQLDRPKMSLFRTFMLQMAQEVISEEEVVKKAAWVKTIDKLAVELSVSDCSKAKSFLKNPPAKKTEVKPVIAPQPVKPRRVFIP